MNDLKGIAFELLAEQCAQADHEWCDQTRACEDVGAEHARRRDLAQRAQAFDAGHERWAVADSQPGHDWSTCALMRTAVDLMLTPPARDPLWRATAITTALARLGERGLPADAVVRTGIGADLIRKILRDASFFWSAATADQAARGRVPRILRPWCDLLDAEAGLAGLDRPSPGHVLAVALAGTTGLAASQWMQSAAIAHVVDWRIDGYLEVQRTPEEIVLNGGKDATRWICDRFTKTYPAEWRPASLSWELAFTHDPCATASCAGVPRAVLGERVVETSALMGAVVSKLTSAVDPADELEGGLDADAVIASLGSMLEQGIFEGARAIARRLHEAHPQDVQLAMAYAFCSIPVNRDAARATMDRLCLREGTEESAVRELNRAACALFDGDLPRARAVVDAARLPDARHHIWLWDPVAALSGEAHVLCEPLSDWKSRLVVASRSQPT